MGAFFLTCRHYKAYEIASVAQSVERATVNREVNGSKPFGGVF